MGAAAAAGGRRRADLRAARRSRSAARSWRRSSSGRWAGRASPAPPTPLRVLLAAAAIGFVNGLFGHALIAAGPPARRAVAERRSRSSSTWR